MSLDVKLQAQWYDQRILAAVVVALAIVAQTLYERRKRVSEGRAPMVSHLIPWVGSALEIGGNPDRFFSRAQYAQLFGWCATGDRVADLPTPRKKHGDVFAMKAFGRVVTYVVSPSVRPDS